MPRILSIWFKINVGGGGGGHISNKGSKRQISINKNIIFLISWGRNSSDCGVPDCDTVAGKHCFEETAFT
jgi:hypothetical protein